MPSKVAKWLTACKPGSTESMNESIEWMYTTVKLLDDFEELFEKLSSSLVADVCQRLYLFYQSASVMLKQFVVFLLPSLVYAYASHWYEESPSFRPRKPSVGPAESTQNVILTNLTFLESCLIGISRHFAANNLNSVGSTFPPTSKSFPLPSLCDSSIFHDAVEVSDLRSNNCDAPLFQSPVSTSAGAVAAVSNVIRSYVTTLSCVDLLDPISSLLSLHSISQFCKLSQRLASLSKHPRIPVSSSLLSDLMHGMDIILFKLDEVDRRTDQIRRSALTIRTSVWEAIDEIDKRAAYNCFPDPLLLCHAVLCSRKAQYGARAITGMKISNGSVAFLDVDSLMVSTKNPPQDDTLVVPPQKDSVVPFMRSHSSTVEVITNASFRPEPLPEDITVSDSRTVDDEKNRNDNASSKFVHHLIASKGHMDSKVNAVDTRRRSAAAKFTDNELNSTQPRTES